MEKLRDKNYQIYFDNYFTRVPLLEELLQRGTCGCSTMRINRKGLPQELWPATKGKKGEENAPCFAKTKKEHLKKSGDTVMFQKGQVSVVAWMKKKGRKPVVIASTITSPTSPSVTVSRRKMMALQWMFLAQDQSRSTTTTRIWEGLTIAMFYKWSILSQDGQDTGGFTFLIFSFGFGFC